MTIIKSLTPVLGPKYFVYLEKETLVDCCLVANSYALHAHRIILSAASSYFEETFTLTTEKYPVILLFDVPQQFLSMILELIYLGKIVIDQKNLDEFQKTLELLKIPHEIVGEFLEIQIKEENTDNEGLDSFNDLDDSNDDKILYHEADLDCDDGEIKPMKMASENIMKRFKRIPRLWYQNRRRILVSEVVKGERAKAMMEMHPETCPFCHKKSKNRKHRNEHVKYCIDNPNRIISRCPLCKKSFCDPYYVRKHIQAVHNPFKTSLSSSL